MAGESKVTTDHKKIQKWTEERKGVPTTVKGTGRNGDDEGILRIHFPSHSDRSSLEEISWEDFFEKFEEEELAFLYQEKTKEGKESRFFKFIDRNSEAAKDA